MRSKFYTCHALFLYHYFRSTRATKHQPNIEEEEGEDITSASQPKPAPKPTKASSKAKAPSKTKARKVETEETQEENSTAEADPPAPPPTRARLPPSKPTQPPVRPQAPTVPAGRRAPADTPAELPAVALGRSTRQKALASSTSVDDRELKKSKKPATRLKKPPTVEETEEEIETTGDPLPTTNPALSETTPEVEPAEEEDIVMENDVEETQPPEPLLLKPKAKKGKGLGKKTKVATTKKKPKVSSKAVESTDEEQTQQNDAVDDGATDTGRETESETEATTANSDSAVEPQSQEDIVEAEVEVEEKENLPPLNRISLSKGPVVGSSQPRDSQTRTPQATRLPSTPTARRVLEEVPKPSPRVKDLKTTPPSMAAITSHGLSAFAPEERKMTLEQYIQHRMELEFEAIKLDGERELEAFVEESKRVRKIIENM